MASIHTYLKELRIEKGLTQEEVADKIGLTRQAISGYESGKRQPGIDILMTLAEIYEVSIETVLYGKRDAADRRRVKRAAIAAAGLFLLLQMVSGLLSTLAVVLYPVEEGIVPPGQAAVLERRIELVKLAEHTERMAAAVMGLGSAAVMGLDLSGRATFSGRKKVGFFLTVLGISWGIALFWGVLHPRYPVLNFVVGGPVYFVSAVFFLGIDLMISGMRQRSRK